jgi:hypothetical protein
MNIAGQRRNVGTDLRFWCSAPGRIRPCDPLLRRHLAGVAGGRLESFYMAISCIDRGWAWLEVALELSPLAPFLAPRSSCLR